MAAAVIAAVAAACVEDFAEMLIVDAGEVISALGSGELTNAGNQNALLNSLP